MSKRDDDDRELEEELQAHLAIEARERIEAGQDPAAAHTAAKRAFGNVTKIREQTRETWDWISIERFLDDLRYGIRILKKTPAWTSAMIAILALGIGLTTAIFSVVYGVLLQSLPFPDAGRLVALWSSSSDRGMPKFNIGAATWRDLRTEAKSFTDIAITRAVASFNLTGNGTPERLQGARTSWNLPQVLGTAPLRGRTFTEKEQFDGAPVAILSHGLWQRRFGQDPNLIGKKIQLNGTPFEVIGIMPQSYSYPSRDFELWTPLYIPPEEFRARLSYDYISVAQLKPGVTVEQAQAEVSTIVHRLGEQYPRTTPEMLVEPLMESTVGQVRSMVYVLFSSVLCLLLIGCVNIGNLLLARASVRTREMALRAALGATAGRLQRQMLAEILPLSVCGAAGGLLIASWLLRILIPLLPPQMPRLEAIGLNLPVVLFSIGLSVLVVVLAGILPSWMASRIDLAEQLKQDSRTSSSSSKVRNTLVIGQVAVTLALLFGGGLLIRSLQSLMQVDPGFGTNGILTMHLAITRAKYSTDLQVTEYCNRLVDRIRSVPGVIEAGMVNRLPLSGNEQTGALQFEGRPETQKINLDWRLATPGYFKAIGIPLLHGRFFTLDDRENSTPVGIVDEQLAKTVFGENDPLGKRFRIALGNYEGPWVEVVGVVGHIRNQGLEKDVRPQVYWPLSQRTQDREVLVIRTAGQAESFTSAIVAQIHNENPEQPVYDVRTMNAWLDRSLQQRHLLTGLVTLFGAASLVLACLGLYGAISYSTGQRLREFGIRMALGAETIQIRKIVLRQAGRLAILGSIAGFALAVPVGILLRSFLYQTGQFDPIVLAAAAVVLIAVALMAGWGPAHRAARLDPANILRTD